MMPILSIVIANYNYGRFLGAAIESVVGQKGFGECELIVVDGGSTDDSADVIKKHADKLAWWISEPDRGQSDAFNKGFARANGKYLTWLNADDVMPAGALEKVVRELKSHPSCEWFTGNSYRFIDGTKRVSEIGWGPHAYPAWMQGRSSPVVVFGPTSFFSKALFDRIGGMNLDCHYTMDTDLWIRFIVAGIKQRRINCFCWAFRMHEQSKTSEFVGHGLERSARERLVAEEQACYRRAGYRASPFRYRLLLLWRFVDFSIARLIWLRFTMIGRRVEEV